MDNKRNNKYQLLLQQLRQQIDIADENILRCLQERLQIVSQIGQLKQQHNQPILDSAREEQVLTKLKNMGSNYALSPSFIEQVFSLIIQESVKQQQILATNI